MTANQLNNHYSLWKENRQQRKEQNSKQANVQRGHESQQHYVYLINETQAYEAVEFASIANFILPFFMLKSFCYRCSRTHRPTIEPFTVNTFKTPKSHNWLNCNLFDQSLTFCEIIQMRTISLQRKEKEKYVSSTNNKN